MTRLGLTLRGELDKTRCEEPGCESHGPFLLSPPCHDVSVFAEYEKGELTLGCGECLQPFLTVPVAG